MVWQEIKLSECSTFFSYQGNKVFDKTFIKDLSLSLLGNNVWIIDKNLPEADPEGGTSSGNIQGFQTGVMPSVKVYSFNLKVKF